MTATGAQAPRGAGAGASGRRRMRLALGIGLLALAAASLAQTPSRLEQFERDATRSRPTAPVPVEVPPYRPLASGESAPAPRPAVDWRVELLGWVPALMADAGAYSAQRLAPRPAGADLDSRAGTPRGLGEATIAFARVDLSGARMGRGIHATAARAEVGYGPWGLELVQRRYTETQPHALLELQHYRGLYRMSLGDTVEVDLGLGRLHMAGLERHRGASWTLPILVHPSVRWGVELRPSWASLNGTIVGDHELALSLGERFWSVRAGYHWLRSPAERLQGPFLGLSARL